MILFIDYNTTRSLSNMLTLSSQITIILLLFNTDVKL